MKVTNFQDTIRWYDENAAQYADATTSTGAPDEIDEFVAAVGSTARVLDAGCGAGRDTASLQKKGIKVVGLDISKGLLAEARQRHPECEFVEGDLLHLPFKAESFDGIWARASLVHLETIADVSQALAEFQRVLKVTGVVFILVKAQMNDKKTAIVSDTVSHHDRFFQYFTVPELTTLLTQAGFSILRIEQYPETKRPSGRPGVDLILALARKT